MDWPKEKIGITERDFAKVFQYEPKATKVVRLKQSQAEPDVETLETDEEWWKWMGDVHTKEPPWLLNSNADWNKKLPSPDRRESGLVMILARRTGQQDISTMRSAYGSTDNEKDTKSGEPVSLRTDRVGGPLKAVRGVRPSTGGSRDARVLPFSHETFRTISKKFFLHGSIARVVNRADVPTFSHVELEHQMEESGNIYPIYVYNCRSANAWRTDLALTVTHFPHSGLTYAILFGCPISVEEDVIRRLCYPGVNVNYPLLLPGIFAEIEKNRHTNIVEKYIDDIEDRNFNLDFQPSVEQKIHGVDGGNRVNSERELWLNMTYLRNGLVTWSTQLSKMASHTKELRDKPFIIAERRYMQDGDLKDMETYSMTNARSRTETRISAMISDRLQAIIEEYEDKIRECTMRIDGMAMSTQWFHGETNVEIALAAGRDSRYMRSISVVTMVFLPGTFCGSIFSMQFFNWIPKDDDNTVVSPYLWIYVLVTVVATVLTLGAWYFVSWYEKQRKMMCRQETAV